MAAGELLMVGAHHSEPSLSPDVGYTEVVASRCEHEGRLSSFPVPSRSRSAIFMMLTIFQQMLRLGRHPRTFVRVDSRNTRSLTLFDRVGLREEHDDTQDEGLVQRWGELPRG